MISYHARQRRRASLLAIPLALSLVGLTGCATAEQAGSAAALTDTTLDANLTAKAVAAAQKVAGDTKLSGSIEYIGPNGGKEGAILEAVYAAFTEATGVKVKYTGTQDVNNIVQSRVQAGNAPDVVDLALGVASGYAESGDLLNLSEVIGQRELENNYNANLLADASVDGKTFGIYQGFSNFMVWYNPEQYSGPIEPASWSEMTDWTDTLAAAGTTPWCIAEESGAGTGFPGAQFIENIFAKTYGPDLLKQWGTGDLAWTSPEVKSAWEAFGEIATDDAKVQGGVTGSLAASIATGSNGLVSDPATCQAVLWGSWVPGLIGADVKPTENLDFFPVPAINAEYEETEVFQSTVAAAFNDTPEVRAFMTYIASTEAQTLLASADQWTVSNQNVPIDTYDSPLLQKAAETYFGDDVQLSSGPNVLADAAVSAAFYKGVVSYLNDPASLDEVLASIQATVGS